MKENPGTNVASDPAGSSNGGKAAVRPASVDSRPKNTPPKVNPAIIPGLAGKASYRKLTMKQSIDNKPYRKHRVLILILERIPLRPRDYAAMAVRAEKRTGSELLRLATLQAGQPPP